MIGTLGNQNLFRYYTRSHGLHELEREVEPYLERMTNWLGVYPSHSNKILAVTPKYDNSANPPAGNRRVKPSSGIMPLAESYDSARFLIETWENMHPNATRFCEVRVPVGDAFGSENVSRALTDSGYRIEAIMPNLFTINGKQYTVNDYARNKPERLSEFPERNRIIPQVMQEVFWNEEVQRLTMPELENLCRNVERAYEIRRARSNDAEGIVSLMQRTFRNYGTFDIATAMPAMIEEASPTASIVYVAKRRENGKIVATGTIERSPFGFGEFTDTAVDQDNFGNNGLATALAYRASSEARQRGITHYYSDNIPHPAISKVAKRLGAVFRGIHENHVRIMTHQLYEQIRRDPDSLDLIVCSGAL